MYIVSIEKEDSNQEIIPEFFYRKEDAEKYSNFLQGESNDEEISFVVYEVKPAD